MYFSIGGLGRFRQLSGKYRRRAEAARLFTRSKTTTIAREVETIVTQALKDAAPVGPDRIDPESGETIAGGGLRDSIKAQLRVSSSNITVGFQAVAYAAFVIGGTQPHVILPQTKKVLAFPVGGQMVFSTIVNHPGTQANPFQTKAMDAARPEINAALARAGKDLMVTFR